MTLLKLAEGIEEPSDDEKIEFSKFNHTEQEVSCL